jgi:hypothetical protein
MVTVSDDLFEQRRDVAKARGNSRGWLSGIRAGRAGVLTQ